LRLDILGIGAGGQTLRSLRRLHPRLNLFLTDSFALSAFFPICALLLPMVTTLYIVRKAQRVTDADRVAMWFSCMRFLRWLVVGTFLAWWVTTDLVHGRVWFESFLGANGLYFFPGAALLFQILFWIPPTLVVVICQMLLQPVYSGVRGITWTRAELVRQMLFSVGASFLPLLFVTSGLTELFRNQSFRSFLISFILAFASAIFFGRQLRKALQLSPNALTTGELRDRAFFLASQLHVKLQQIYLLPPGKSRMANAFARSGYSILLTHYLLSQLTRREVDAVVAHELAHLKHDHPRLLGFALMGGFAAVAVPYFSFSPQEQWRPAFDVLFVAIPLLTYYFVARRFEFTADATAARVTNDPEAMITGLVKLHRLNLLPLQWGKWSEKFLTHPSTVRRAHSIARAANLTEGRVATLLQETMQTFSPLSTDEIADGGERYQLPSPESLHQKIFSTEFKQSLSLRAYLLSLALMVMLPALLFSGITVLGILASEFLIFTAVLVLSVMLFLLFLNFLPLIGAKRLQREMHARALSDGTVPLALLEQGAAKLVGFSPGPAPRIFEGNYSWDLGYLYIGGDRLCYCGEETRFSLRRDQIAAVRLGPGVPGWFRARSLYIVWRDISTDSSAIFNVRPLAVPSVLAMNRAVNQLSEQIETWRDASNPNSGSSIEDPVALPLPQVRAVTGTSLADQTKSRLLLALVVYGALMAGVVAYFMNLPFGGFFSVFADDAGSASPVTGDSGWYVVLCSLVLILLFIVPLLRARNSAVSLSGADSQRPSPRRPPGSG
jgi:Zn-dependent protease with chaperone function